MNRDTTEGSLFCYFPSFADQKILNISLVKIEIDNRVKCSPFPWLSSRTSTSFGNLNDVIEIDRRTAFESKIEEQSLFKEMNFEKGKPP